MLRLSARIKGLQMVDETLRKGCSIRANRLFTTLDNPCKWFFYKTSCQPIKRFLQGLHETLSARFTMWQNICHDGFVQNLLDSVANCKCLVDRWRCRHSSLLNKNNVFNSQNDKKTIMGRCLNIFQDWHITWLLYFSMFWLFIFLPVYLLFWAFMSPTAKQFCIGTRFFRIL